MKRAGLDKKVYEKMEFAKKERCVGAQLKEIKQHLVYICTACAGNCCDDCAVFKRQL